MILGKNNWKTVNFVLWRGDLETVFFPFSSAPLTFDKSFQFTSLCLSIYKIDILIFIFLHKSLEHEWMKSFLY